ncbi:ATP-grasp domain-containing protein [Ascidiimonas sp. W6]|uniref:ATP-grasp domain-containing protein n=1 Tax=Ascidiimonas meishanensis TaxID=3128903 RepID=UPI0030EB77BD
MNILITSAGRRVSLLNFFKEELTKKFPHGKVFITELDPQTAPAAHAADKHFQVKKVTDKNYISQLLKLCKDENISLIIPTIDTELPVLAENYKKFKDLGIEVVISEVDRIACFQDKRTTHTFFNEMGIEAPKIYEKDNYQLPIFVKPYNGSRSINTYKITSEDYLMPYLFKDETLMFLEYLSSDTYDEFTCDMYYDKSGELKCIVPRKRIEIRGGEVSKGITVKSKLINFLDKHLGTIKGMRGCVAAQFFVNKENGSVIGIEINPRFGGGYPLSHLAGANYAKWIIEEYLCEKEIDKQLDFWEDKLLMLRYDDEILVRNHLDS